MEWYNHWENVYQGNEALTWISIYKKNIKFRLDLTGFEISIYMIIGKDI